MALSSEQKMNINLMTHKQRMRCIIDVSANLESIQSAMRSFNAYRKDDLDDGLAEEILKMRQVLEQKLWCFSDKLTALTATKE